MAAVKSPKAAISVQKSRCYLGGSSPQLTLLVRDNELALLVEIGSTPLAMCVQVREGFDVAQRPQVVAVNIVAINPRDIDGILELDRGAENASVRHLQKERREGAVRSWDEKLKTCVLTMPVRFKMKLLKQN